MEQLLYERPREKLRYRGASSLSLAELFQVVIGSGNSKVPVAKIARKVATKVETTQGSPTYEDLMIIEGLGDAKVCQVLAVLELAKRQGLQASTHDVSASPPGAQELKASKKQLLVYETFSGGKVVLKKRVIEDISGKYKTLLRRICADLVIDGAASVSLALGYAGQSLEPSVAELSFMKSIVDSSASLQVKVQSLWLVNAVQSVDMKKVSL